MNDEHDERNIDQERRRKVQNFRVHIEEEPAEEMPETTISSYSNPGEAKKRRESFPDAGASERAKLAHKLRDREKGKKNRNFFRLIWFGMVLLFSILSARYLVAGMNDMLGVDRQAVNVTVEVPKNAAADKVTDLLYQVGAIKDKNFFRFYSRMTKAPQTYDGGSYQITTGMDYEAIINSIQSSQNRVDTVKVTFTEGMNAMEIAEKLEKNGVCPAKEAMKAFNTTDLDKDYDVLAAIPGTSERYYRLEGYLFPDTYWFFKNEDPKDAVEKLVGNCSNKLTKQIRQKAKDGGMSVDQLLTLASMIQAEAADKTDMYRVSSVFHNRLSSKDTALLHLDSDPTTIYPYRQRSQIPAAERDSYKSKYDTYTVVGLPAGPVCNPGLDAIDAALNPDSTGYYYFCHSKDGKAYYARTLAGHEENLEEAGLK